VKKTTPFAVGGWCGLTVRLCGGESRRTAFFQISRFGMDYAEEVTILCHRRAFPCLYSPDLSNKF